MIKLLRDFFKSDKEQLVCAKSGKLYKHRETGDMHRCLMNGCMVADNTPVVIFKNMHTDRIYVIGTNKFLREHYEKT